MNMMVKKFSGILNKNSPTILTAVAVTGVISTVVMAVKATPKALQILDEEHIKNANETPIGESVKIITIKDKIELLWPVYTPAAIMGLVTIGCIIGANKINLRRNAALVGLYSLSESTLKEYQKKIIETIGDKKEKIIRDEIKKDQVKKPVKEEDVIFTGLGDTLCYDSISGRYFKSDIEKIKQSMNKVSRRLMSDHFITLNEVYYEIGLKSIKMGEIIGWHVDDGLIEPEFTSHLNDNGIPCLVLDYTIEPRYNYNDY